MLQMNLCKELGYTLNELQTKVTVEELVLWSAFFDLHNEAQEQQMRKARRR